MIFYSVMQRPSGAYFRGKKRKRDEENAKSSQTMKKWISSTATDRLQGQPPVQSTLPAEGCNDVSSTTLQPENSHREETHSCCNQPQEPSAKEQTTNLEAKENLTSSFVIEEQTSSSTSSLDNGGLSTDSNNNGAIFNIDLGDVHGFETQGALHL